MNKVQSISHPYVPCACALQIRDTYFLVNVVDNNYINGDIFALFDDAASRIAKA